MKKYAWIALSVASLAVLGVALASVFATPSDAPHGWGRGWRWHDLNQTQIVTSESVVEGTISDADVGYLIISTVGGEVRLAAPPVWTYHGERRSLFRLFAEDLLNIGDRVRVVVLTVQATRPNGMTTTVSISKTITDLSTGVEVYAVLPARLSSQETQPQTDSAGFALRLGV
jgi:hypothetical protein